MFFTSSLGGQRTMYLPGLHVLRGMAWKIEACAANVRTTTK